MKRVALISLVAGYLVLWPMLMHMASAQTSATMSYSLSNGSSVDLNANRRFSIGVQINTGGNNSGGFDATLIYDSSELSFVSATYTSAYDGYDTTPDNTINGANSTVEVGRISSNPQASPLNNTSATTVANVTFEVVSGVTSSTLDWVYTQDVTWDFTTVWDNVPADELLGNKPGAVNLSFNAYVPAPTITNLNPNNGPATGGNNVTITGSNFGTSNGTVLFGTTNAAIVSWGISSIIVAANPGTAGGTATVRVTTSGGQQSGPATYTYDSVPTPNISNLNPNNGPAAGGTSVIITGSNFGTSNGTVSWGSGTATISSWSTGSITVTAPFGTAGTVAAVRVTTNSGQQSNSVNYTYNSVTVITPDITGLNPSHGPAAGGTSVAISGSNFGTSGGSVTFGGTSVTSSGWSATSITVTAPAGIAGSTVYVIVTTTANGSTDATDLQATYLYDSPTNPNITNINPNQGSEDGGTAVTLSGSNFGLTEGIVYIGGSAVDSGDVSWSSTSIIFTTPAYATTGNYTAGVYIVSSSSIQSNTVNFTYLDEDSGTTGDMSISYLSPSSGRADQTVVVTIYGSGFGSSQGTVKFGQYDATVTSWTDTQIRVNAPVLGSITSDITYPVVVTQGAESASSYYTYLAPGSTGGDGTTTSGGTSTTPASGLPTVAWLGLITMNGGLALVVKRKFFA